VIVSLFAGGGDGWALALRALGRECVGLEWEAAECATRAVVGLPTIRADVSTYPTAPLRGRVEGIIAGPPCQDWSSAGKRAGVSSARGRLVYEPMRWIEDLSPEWVAMEQVPEVLPIWRQYRELLVSLGYSAWCGLLDAASYGVPQNRERAILIASRRHRVQPPEPTHSRSGADELFGVGRQRRVSMAEALGGSLGPRLLDRRQTSGGGGRVPLVQTSRSAPTVTGAPGVWVWRTPAGTQSVSQEELSILQGFPADHPWQGNKTERCRQIGNAVPPALAAAVLSAVLS